MLTEQFAKSKYLVIVFPGGCGGNHIQNMISLLPNFNKVFDSSNYYSDLLNLYTNINPDQYLHKKNTDTVGIQAHFGKFSNLTGLKDKNFVDNMRMSDKKTILIAHDQCIHLAIKEKVFVNFEDCVWIVVTWPQTKDCFVHRRIMYRNHWPQQTYRYTFPYLVPTTFNYVDCNRGFALDPIKIFSVNGSHYLRKKLYDYLNLELPIEADKLHKIWFQEQEYFTQSSYTA